MINGDLYEFVIDSNFLSQYISYYIKQKDKLITNIVKTEVLFNDLDDDLIKRYIATGSPLDKAGAYGYQDNNDFPLVKKITGSVSNVIGFPVEEIKEDLKQFSKENF